MTHSSSPSPGNLFLSGRYRIQRKLGSGSTGSVYLAHDEKRGRAVSLKILRRERLAGQALASLQREFRSIASLRHPRIASAHDFGYWESGGGRIPYYTREYVRGEPLAPGPPGSAGESPREFLAPIVDLLEALHYLHTHDILHLDVHAGNLVVSGDPGRGAVLIDFGLIPPRDDRGASPLLLSGRNLAPEVLHGLSLTPATDLYAVGRLLLYRLTGHYEGHGDLPPEIAGWGPRITLELERIVSRSLREDPSMRFGSALEFRDALVATLGSGDGPSAVAEPGLCTVGRDAELESVEAALRAAAQGGTAALWFQAGHGLGKTRLLTEARWRSQLRGLETVEQTFHRGAAPERTLAHALGSGDTRRSREKIWLAPLSREHGGSTRERARRAAEAYFREPGPPLVVLLDDIEYADRESHWLAQALLGQVRTMAGGPGTDAPRGPGRGLAVIVASGDRPPGELLRGRGSLTLVEVRALSSSDSIDLLERLLRPLRIDRDTAERLAREARGSPERLRRFARTLLGEYGPTGSVPADAILPRTGLSAPGESGPPSSLPAGACRVLTTLAILDRAADRREIAAATGLSSRTVDVTLGSLADLELVSSWREGRFRLFDLSTSEIRERLAADAPLADRRKIHASMAEHLGGLRRLDHRQEASLARHLLAAGRRRQGREAALKAADRLARSGWVDAAVLLLEETASGERGNHWSFRLAERISDLHAITGDHPEGIAGLESLRRRLAGSLSAAESIRLRRRLGVHYHRAGHPQDAVKLFREAIDMARVDRDRDELVFIYSELAEIHTFRGEYDEAGRACALGLKLLHDRREAGADFAVEMEVTLKATLGHLELRRQRARPACEALESALERCRGRPTIGLRGLILNNLGIVYNQLNRFSAARRCFEEAESILSRSGERSTLVHLACNRALIAAKLGETGDARTEIERAARLLHHHPGERLEFFLAFSRATVHHHVGAFRSALDEYAYALPLGRKFGDEYIVRYAEVYRAEALLACGRLSEAHRALRKILGPAREHGPAILARTVATRLLWIEQLLGRPRARRDMARILAGIEVTGVDLLEAWNELILAGASWIGIEPHGPGDLTGGGGSLPGPSGKSDSGGRTFERIERTFASMGVVAGRRLARLGRLECASRAGSASQTRELIREIERDPVEAHGLLDILEPLVIAGASLRAGDLDRATSSLERASGAMVGLPYLELDWRIEHLSARLAERKGERETARHHLHRCLQAREMIQRLLPERWRAAFLRNARFRPVEDLRERLERPGPHVSTPLLRPRGPYHGLVGSSPAMRRIIETIEKIRDIDLPVLIVGETGTGKELVARAIHSASSRRGGPFQALACSALPPQLFESELFGYEAGAFTGATDSRGGLLDYLEGGTLLLDGLDELSTTTQAKLLQVMDRGVIRPLGGLDTRAIDVRFLTTMREAPEEAIRKQDLRADLYHRFGSVEITLAPLRDRRDDIPALAEHLLARQGRLLGREPPRLRPGELEALAAYDWPGNVRQLEALLLRVLLGHEVGTEIQNARLLLPRRDREPAASFSAAWLDRKDLRSLHRDLERAYLERLFLRSGGDLARVGATLGRRRAQVYAWFRRAGLDVRELRKRLERPGESGPTRS